MDYTQLGRYPQLGNCQEQKNTLGRFQQQCLTETYMRDLAKYKQAYACAISTDTYKYATSLPPTPITRNPSIRDKLRAEIKEWCGGILERY